jgi:hypothetical protein
MITAPEDYIGKFALSNGMFSTNKLQIYIDRYEQRYLRELLGVELYNQFESDLIGGLPQSPNFIKIFEALAEDVGSYFYTYNRYYQINEIIDSAGMYDMLQGFVYFEYSKDLKNQMTPYGNVKQNAENSEVVNTLFSTMYNRYNESVKSYDSIQQYILLNQDASIGQVVNATLLNGGSGYVDSTNVPTLNGTGTNCTVDIVTDGLGLITELYINDGGKDYAIGDTLIIDAGNQDAEFEINYVGKGDFKLFKGKRKLTAYWL